MTRMETFDRCLLDAAKWAFTTRRVNRDDVHRFSRNFDAARAGDLLLCRIDKIGQHKRIQLAERRVSESYPGDLVVLCLGDRYAPDQFHASATIGDGVVHLVAGGGMAGTVEAAHDLMRAPTQLSPIALLENQAGEIINIGQYGLPNQPRNDTATVIGVFGASMNSGKTTAAACLAHGLRAAGHAVAGIKATGTGAFGDYNAFEDAGVAVMDFTDVGMASTYRQPMARIEEGFHTLVATAANAGAEVIVVEIADGVFQQETRAVLAGGGIRDRLDGILFAAPDALSAMGSVFVLEQYNLSPFAISGKVSCSPLAVAEATEVTGLPILSREELCDPRVVSQCVAPFFRPPQVDRAA